MKKPFSITERDPLNQSIIKKLNTIAKQNGNRMHVRTHAIALIVKEIKNPHVLLVGRYMNAVTFL